MMNATREIESRLAVVRRRIRRAQAWRGAGLVVTVALGGLGGAMVLDLAAGVLPGWARWVVFAAWVAGVLWALRRAAGPLLRPIGLVSVARWLEGRHPEMEERLSTALEVSRDEAVSPWLLEELVRAAERDAGEVNPEVEVRPGVLARKWARPAVGLLVLLAVALAWRPGETGRLLLRAVAPFSEAGTVGVSVLAVTPGDLEVLEGGAIRIEAKSSRAEGLEVVMEFEGGRVVAQPMGREGGVHRYVLEPAVEGFRYRVKAGRAQSDVFQAKVWPSPKLAGAKVRLEFPAYTELAEREELLGARVEAVTGTRVRLAGELNTAVEEAWMELDGERFAEGEIETAATGGRVVFGWEMRPGLAGEAVVFLRHRLGEGMGVLRFAVESLADGAPEVVLLSPAVPELQVRPEELLELRYEIREDFGLAEAMLEAEASGKEPVVWPQDLPAPVPRTKPARYRGAVEVSVGEIRDALEGAGELRVRVAAEDARPGSLDGPGRGESRWLTLRIDEGAESLARQQLREEHDGARRTLEEAARQAREARERMNWHRGEVERERFSEEAMRHFEEAAERLAAAQEKLEELAVGMEESVHGSKADEVREAAEKLELARQELESVPLQDGAERRGEKLDAARESAEEVARQLDAVREALEGERERVEDLARLQELAARQRELARQAGERLEDERQPEDWRNRQRGVEEELRRRLREQPEAAQAVLEARAGEARALAEEAKELAEAQRELGKMSREGASDESLKEALAREQEAISREADAALAKAREERASAADVLPEAVAAAKEAGDAMKEDQAAEAAAAAKEAAERLAEAAQTGDGESPREAVGREKLGDLAERQEQVAEALEGLARKDEADVMEALRAMQAEAAKGFAEGLERLPVPETPGALHEARNASRQAQRQAGEAAERGREGKAEEAGQAHGRAEENFQRSAEALVRTAQDFARMAEEASGRQANASRAPAPAGELAEAFEEAAQAGSAPSSPEAAESARKAAEALARAAREARESMQGRRQPGMPLPGMMPGDRPEEGERPPLPDPGVPPELAKLGISAEDWEKIRESLRADVGKSASGGVPEEYRGLVKEYFQNMAGRGEEK